MATYEFRCPTCDTVFEEQRPMSESGAPATCPRGHAGARRMLSAFASLTSGPTASVGAERPAAPCGAACACHPA